MQTAWILSSVRAMSVTLQPAQPFLKPTHIDHITTTITIAPTATTTIISTAYITIGTAAITTASTVRTDHFTTLCHTVNPNELSCVADDLSCTASGRSIIEASAIVAWDWDINDWRCRVKCVLEKLVTPNPLPYSTSFPIVFSTTKFSFSTGFARAL